MIHYSFLEEAQFLEEKTKKSTIAAILASLGLIGASPVKLPAAYVRTHPGEVKVIDAITARIMEPSKVNYTKEFSKGFRTAMDAATPESVKKAKKLGDSILKTSSGKTTFKDNVIDSFKGRVEI